MRGISFLSTTAFILINNTSWGKYILKQAYSYASRYFNASKIKSARLPEKYLPVILYVQGADSFLTGGSIPFTVMDTKLKLSAASSGKSSPDRNYIIFILRANPAAS
jgi:hypothetical protein